MLLAELITLLSDPKQSLGEAVYKTKVLFHQLGRKDLVPWVTHEITGYPDECEVPPYRLIGAQVRCNLMNTGWTNSNQLLIIAHLDADEQKAITEIKLRFPIEVIQESIRKYGENSNNRMVSNIAPETFGRFNQVITNGGRLTAAWSELNMGDVTGVLSSVRSRLLDFVLELKDQIDTAQVSVTPDAGLPERLEQAGINAGDIFKNAVFTDSSEPQNRVDCCLSRKKFSIRRRPQMFREIHSCVGPFWGGLEMSTKIFSLDNQIFIA